MTADCLDVDTALRMRLMAMEMSISHVELQIRLVRDPALRRQLYAVEPCTMLTRAAGASPAPEDFLSIAARAR